MAQNKVVRFGPRTVTAAAKDQINPGTATAGTGIVPAPAAQYVLIKHIRLVNTTAAAITVSGFVGATGASAAGTEVFGSSGSVAANSFSDWYPASPGLRLDNADFLVTTASGAGVTLQGEGEIGVA